MTAFPQAILDTRVDLLLGGAWTTITSYVYERDKITITAGHPDEASRATPATAALTVDDRTGRFAPRNPNGAYYGLIGRNTPLRISTPENATYLRSENDQTGGAQCPSTAGLNITGDLDVQIETTLDSYFVRDYFLCGKYTSSGNQRSWALYLFNTGPAFVWSPDGTSGSAHTAVTASIPAGTVGRIALRVTFAAATGTVTFYTGPSIAAGTWTQLGPASVLGSATSIFSSTAPVTVGYNASWAAGGDVLGYQGKIHAFKLLNGIGGTVKASPDFTAQTDGATSFNDAQGNTWSVVNTAEISGRKYRFHGEVPAWPQKWDLSQTDIYAPIQASGLLRRLGLPNAPPLRSALYRAYVRATGVDVPLAYWPCEDGTGSTSIASALTGAAPMAVNGTPTFASFTGFACSAALPLLSKSTWTGAAPPYSGTPNANAVQFLLGVPSSGAANNGVVMRMNTTGTVARLDLVYTTGGNLQLNGYGAAGATLFTGAPFAVGTDGQLIALQMSLEPNGGNVNYVIWYYNLTKGGGAAGAINTFNAASIGQITTVVANPGGLIDDTALGHIAVGFDDSHFSSYSAPFQFGAWAGEHAGRRFVRLCTEEGVGVRVYGDPNDTPTMGAQTLQSLLSLLQECEDADRGLIYEPREALALGYRTRTSMYNQSAALALDYSLNQLANELVPQDDDQLTLNDVTVQRTGGSSARQVLASGAMSIQAPPNGVGAYPTSPTINVQSDAQLPDEAGWILHTGTVDEPRYPAIHVDLARPQVAGMFYTAPDVRIGDRITVAHTPSFLPPDGISQIVRGYTEVCYGFTFTLAWVCSPESPFRVALLEDVVLGRCDTDGSTLNTSVSSGATSLSVATTNAGSPLWTTNPADCPFDIEMGGERMTVTNITGASSPQTFTVTRSVNGVVKAQTAGTDVRLFQPMILGL